MPYSIEPHTADVRLKVSAESFPELFSESVAALMAVVHGRGEGEVARREIELSARDSTSLLVDFLSEVLALCHINREIYDKVTLVKVTETEVKATLSGRKVTSFGGDVKAVTYHEAQVKQENGEWQVNLVLDV